MKIRSTLLATSLLTVSAFAQAGTSANIYVASDYLFRGVSQTNNGAAVQGGLDFESESGFYAGTWMSNMFDGGGIETDLYLGFAGSAGDFGYDVGVITYIYPDLEGWDATEVYIGGSYGVFDAKYWYETDGDWSYLEANLSFDVGNDVGLGLHLGSADFDGGGDYLDYNISLSKAWKDLDWSLMLSDTDIDGDDWTMAVSAGYSFDL